MQKNKGKIVTRMLHTASDLHVREAGEGGAESRTITGYAILFGVPSAPLYSFDDEVAREVIAPGAVTKELLDGSDIKMTMFHDRQLILARSKEGAGTLSYGVDDKGVYFEFEAPNTVDGDKALELLPFADWQKRKGAEPAEAQLKALLRGENIKSRFNDILGKKAPGFISSIISCVNGNTMLQEAEPQSILNSAVIAATLDLPINQNLGFAAIVPYNDRKKGQCVAQFQLMYKGLIELCLRSGQFASLIDEVVYEGQLVKRNKFTGEYVFDEDAQTSDKVIGYMAYFRLVNGFEKTFYMTTDEVSAHAKRYSQSYQKGYGVWKDDFNTMARKTVLKLLLAKYAPKSIEMQQAIIFDQAAVKSDLTETSVDEAEIEYVDNEPAKDLLGDIAAEAAGAGSLFDSEGGAQ